MSVSDTLGPPCRQVCGFDRTGKREYASTEGAVKTALSAHLAGSPGAPEQDGIRHNGWNRKQTQDLDR